MKVLTTLTCIFQFWLTYSQTSTFSLIDNPTKRLKSVYYYMSRDLGVPQNINDSTVFLINKSDYHYDDKNRLTTIVSNIYKWDYNSYDKIVIKTGVDSILYLNGDSALITQITFEKDKKWIEHTKIKIIDYQMLIISLPRFGRKELSYTDAKGKVGYAVIKTKQGHVCRIRYKTPNYSDDYKILYDDNHKVKKIGKNSYIEYLNNKDFKLFESYGAFSGIFFYYFDSDGFLIKLTEEYDTNPNITIYEYEMGKGNAISFVYSISSLLKLSPLIY